MYRKVDMRRISNCSLPQNYSCIKALVYYLSHDCNFDIDRDVSTAHCKSSSGDGVDLVSPQYGLFLPPWLLVTGVSTT